LNGTQVAPAGSGKPANEDVRRLDAQIAARRAQLAPGHTPSADTSGTVASAGANAIVELESNWQKRLRALSDARTRRDDVRARTARARLAADAARSAASELMAVVEPAYRPTHPAKGGRSRVVIIGGLIALALAIGYASLTVALDDRLFVGGDIEALGVTPLLAVVPRIAATPHKKRRTRASAA
jgi:hypothetical protein